MALLGTRRDRFSDHRGSSPERASLPARCAARILHALCVCLKAQDETLYLLWINSGEPKYSQLPAQYILSKPPHPIRTGLSISRKLLAIFRHNLHIDRQEPNPRIPL